MEVSQNRLVVLENNVEISNSSVAIGKLTTCLNLNIYASYSKRREIIIIIKKSNKSNNSKCEN